MEIILFHSRGCVMASPSLPYSRNWPLSTDTKNNFVFIYYLLPFSSCLDSFFLPSNFLSFTSFCPLSPAFPSFFALLPFIFPSFPHSFTLPFILFFSLFVLSTVLPHFHSFHFVISFPFLFIHTFSSIPPSIHPSCRIYPDSRARAQLYLQSFSRAWTRRLQWKNFPLKSLHSNNRED